MKILKSRLHGLFFIVAIVVAVVALAGFLIISTVSIWTVLVLCRVWFIVDFFFFFLN